MNKKIVLLLIVGLFLAVGSSAFGAVGYERTPSGYTIENPVSFSVSGVFDEYPTALSYQIRVSNDLYEQILSDCFSANNQIVEMTLPFDEYVSVGMILNTELGCGSYMSETDLEYDGGDIIFEVVEGEEEERKPFFTIENSDITTLMASVSDIFTDADFFIMLAVGLPLAFWIINRIVKDTNEYWGEN